MNTHHQSYPPASQPIPQHQSNADVFIEIEKHRAEKRSRFAALALAFLIHALVIAFFAWLVVGDFSTDPLSVEIHKPAQGEDKPFVPDPKKFADLVKKPSRPSGGAAKSVLLANALSKVTVAEVEIDTDAFGFSDGNDFGDGRIGNGEGTPEFGIPRQIKGRCNQADRIERLRENGGRPALDRQVVKALDWLMTQQNEDGSWGETYPVAMTAFALLSFCGHCETVDSPRYGEALVKAINYLTKIGRDNDGMLATNPGQYAPYEHGIATYALAEAYSINKNSKKKIRISPTLSNAVPIIIEGQTEGGGWLYGYGSNGTGDLSISGWNIQALKAAELTGRRFTGLSRAKKKALEYIKSASTPAGLYRYRIRDNDNGRLSLVGVGVLSARMLGEEMDNEDKSFAAILAQKPRQFRAADLYALYYHSQACFQKGGKVWSDYNSSYQKMVIDSQEKDGSWPVASGHVGAAKADAKVYHTCLCTLMMEVYYRYLPATDKASM